MITSRLEIAPREFPYTAQNVFDHIENYLAPLQRTGNAEDARLYSQARSHISYFRKKLSLEQFQKPEKELTNWQFLQLLATCWRHLGVADNSGATSQDLTNRLGLEDAGVRALHRYNICFVNLFPRQQTYSIYGFDPAACKMSLREMIEEKMRGR